MFWEKEKKLLKRKNVLKNGFIVDENDDITEKKVQKSTSLI